MTTLYLCEPANDDVDIICFDHESAWEKYHSIKIDNDRERILKLSSGNDYSQFNPIKLFHALLVAIDHGWFVPNEESIVLLKKINCHRSDSD